MIKKNRLTNKAALAFIMMAGGPLLEGHKVITFKGAGGKYNFKRA